MFAHQLLSASVRFLVNDFFFFKNILLKLPNFLNHSPSSDNNMKTAHAPDSQLPELDLGYLVDIYRHYDDFILDPIKSQGTVEHIIKGTKPGIEPVELKTIIPRSKERERERERTRRSDKYEKARVGHSVVGKDEFEHNFRRFSNCLFKKGFPWSNVTVIGGGIVSCLLGSDIGFEGSDIDLYIYGISDLTVFVEKVKSIINFLKQSIPDRECILIKTPCTVSVCFGYPYRTVQIIIGNWYSIGHLLSTVDIAPTGVAYDGERVYTNRRGQFGWNSRASFPSERAVTVRGAKEYPNRLLKYSKRGFAVVDPGANPSASLLCRTSGTPATVEKLGIQVATNLKHSRKMISTLAVLTSKSVPCDLFFVVFAFINGKSKPKARKPEQDEMPQDLPFGKWWDTERLASWAEWKESTSISYDCYGGSYTTARYRRIKLDEDWELGVIPVITSPYTCSNYHTCKYLSASKTALDLDAKIKEMLKEDTLVEAISIALLRDLPIPDDIPISIPFKLITYDRCRTFNRHFQFRGCYGKWKPFITRGEARRVIPQRRNRGRMVEKVNRRCQNKLKQRGIPENRNSKTYSKRILAEIIDINY